MWVATTAGFYSAVQHRDDPDLLVVRARDRADADNLAAFYTDVLDGIVNTPADDAAKPFPTPEVIAYETSDYPWRIIMPKWHWAEFLTGAVEDLDYGNFKEAVKVTQGPERAAVYHTVWAALLRLEELDPQGRVHTYLDDPWEGEDWDEYDDWEADGREPTQAEVTRFLDEQRMSEAERRAEDWSE